MENNFIHAVAYTLGLIFKHIIQLYFSDLQQETYRFYLAGKL